MKKKIFLLIIVFILLITGCNKKENNKQNEIKQENKVEEKVNIVDLESDSRPYAVVINNFPSAVKVQSGLNEAYIVYEFPIEGGISRSMALFKDKTDLKIGTIRSARHNYLDYVLENDAIFVHFEWSHKAEIEVGQLDIDNIDGNYMDPKPFWRENPEGLATEHTVYTNLTNISEYTVNTKKYRTTTESPVLLKYSPVDIDLSVYEGTQVANSITIPYSGAYNVKFVYDEENQMYNRYVNNQLHADYYTGETYNTKNIIITLLNWGVVTEYADAAGNNYLDLYNIGTGNGYYITNGYLIPITWEKSDRSSQTKYLHNGKEIEISDGNTYIMFQNANLSTTIE